MKPLILTTWDTNPCDVPELKGLDVDWIQVPLTRTVSEKNPDLKKTLAEGSGWLVVFSKASLRSLHEQGVDFGSLSENWKLAVVGPASSELALDLGAEVALIGPGTGEDLAKEIIALSPEGHIALLTGDLVSQAVLACFSASGLPWARYAVYSNIEPPDAEGLDAALKQPLSAVCLASPSAVERFVSRGGLKSRVPLLAIGPSTAAKIREQGGEPAFVGDSQGFASFAKGLKRLT